MRRLAFPRALRIELSAGRELTDAVVRLRRVRIDPKGVEHRPEQPRALTVALFNEARRAVRDHRHHRDVRRQRPAPPTLLRDHRPVVRPIVADRTGGCRLAGEYVVRRGQVVDVVVRHRPDETQFVCPCSQHWQVFANLQPWDGCPDGLELAAIHVWRIRLQVPGILLGRPAPHEEDDARLGGPARGQIGRPCPKQGRQPQPEQTECPRAKEVAPRKSCQWWRAADLGVHSSAESRMMG